MATQANNVTLNPRPSLYLSLLDEKTLVNIFKHLDLYDLLQIGVLDMNYQRIIGEHIIAKGTLNVSEVSPHFYTRHTLKQLGEFATSLIIKEGDIQYKDEQYSFIGEIFRIIQKRCTVGRLKSIEITLDKDVKESREITMVPDVFKHIESLTIKTHKNRVSEYNDLIAKVVRQCVKLKSLELHGNQSSLNFLLSLQLKCFESLSFKHGRIWRMNWLPFFLVGLPHLKSLELIDFYIPIIPIAQIANAFPNLKKLSWEKPSYQSWQPSSLDWSQIDELRKLEELKTRYFDSADIVAALTKRNQIERMSIDFRYDAGRVRDFVPLLTNLQSVELFVADHQFDEYIQMFAEIANLPNIEECTLVRVRCLIKKEIITAFAVTSERLRVLRIHVDPKGYCNNKLQTIASCFYDSLVKERSWRIPNAPPLHLYARFNKLKRYRPNVIVAHQLPEN